MSEYSKAYYRLHKDRWPAYVKKWRISNPDKVRKISSDSYKKWSRENPDKIKDRDRKKRNAPKGKLNSNVSRAIRKSLSVGGKNGRRWEELVGYSVSSLKKHLGRRFKPGMNWENYGTYWNIDHIIPQSAFNYERPEDIDFKRCWSLKNLQPLETHINFSKRAMLVKPFQPTLTI